ncbi:MAG TPA: uroporphyrinogen decarboxylase family protein [Spirochaetia bacterium]|nr:uroporphyrinogen decarboxylase family protein [Spirochaetia bacterium]
MSAASMTSRERVRAALAHRQPDRPPVDLGSTLVTGIQVSAYARLKKALGVDGGVNRVYDPFQMLGQVEEPVKRLLGVDTMGIELPTTIFGYRNENWKPFTMFDGTEVQISGHFETDVLPGGDLVQYARGDRSAPPSGHMPKGGFYFDTIVRQEPIVEEALDPKEWVAQTYSLYTEEELRFLEETARHWYDNSSYSLIGNFWGAGFGDIATVPGPAIPHPKGIRDPEEWYVSFLMRKEYIREIFHLQLELQMKNLRMYQQAVGDRIEVAVMSGTDFGSQKGPFISPASYREVFKPLHKEMNDWVHAHTSWKTFYHTCGSVMAFMDDFAEAGIDILNPVQVSAADMAPETLKERYGDRFVFWGGAVDAQHTLAFGTPEAVREEVARNVRVFNRGGGFVFNNVHNIQATVPTENIRALFEAVGTLK